MLTQGWRTDTFIKEILDKFSKENLGTLTELDNFQTLLTEFSKKIFFNTNSWARTYLDFTTPFILTNESKVYSYKKDYNTPEKITAAETELDGILKEFIQKLSSNSVAGKNGSYTVSGKVTKSEVPINIDIGKIKIDVTDKDVNFDETYKEIFRKDPSKSATTIEFKQTYTPIINSLKFYIFDGKGRFNEVIEVASKNITTLRTEIEQKITESLTEQLSRKDSGIGFKPTIRNILAPFFA